MKGIIISESLVIRKGVAEILQNEPSIEHLDEGYMCSDIDNDEYDLIIFDLNRNTMQYMDTIKEIKENSDKKVMVLDFYEDVRIFSKCMKVGVDSILLRPASS